MTSIAYDPRACALSLCSLLIAACASAPRVATSPSEPAADAVAEVSHYTALAIGNAWTFQVRAAGSTSSDTIRIVGRDGPWFLDDHRGRLRIDSLGLRDGARYLLRGPIAVGKSWSSVEEMAVQRFEITSTDAQLDTPAGHFEKCVVVRNQQPVEGGGIFSTEWTYAPEVGMVQLRTRTVSTDGKAQEQLRLTLSKFERAAP
jgi:hypothetical protein